MKILITGSEGSLMQSTIPKLLNQGHQILGVDNLYRHGTRMNELDDYTFVEADALDFRGMNEIFNNFRPEYVIQAAAKIYGIGGFNTYCADILGDDVTLHRNILKCSARYGVKKLTYISSSMVYENCPQEILGRVTEDMPDNYPAPTTEYGLSKFVGERLTKAYQTQYGLDYLIFRPFNIITPYEKGDHDIGISHVFADYIKNIVTNKLNTIPIIGDGNQIRCFTWIDEVSDVIAKNVTSETKNDVFNIGRSEPIKMRELAQLIADTAYKLGLLDKKKLDFHTVMSYNNDVLVRIPSTTKTQHHLHWVAKVPVEDSIKMCLEHLITKK